jgi:hypothetical protein
MLLATRNFHSPLASWRVVVSHIAIYIENAGRFSKTFKAEILVQTAKYCLPQIKYLLIHVFLINFRQGNVKLVLLKELKPIILHVASEN